jgi:hypothetical protein
LYELNPNDVNNYNSYELTGTTNVDWEEISQDVNFLYVGDFGNNGNGNRTDLKVLRIEKSSLLQNNPIIDTISFSYATQTDFTPTGSNNTNFDCEAFIVSTDAIYLFTKEWLSNKTSIYSLPKTPGTHVANFIADYDVEGLITGAIYSENDRLIVLSGYSLFLQPFLFLLYDFQNDDFFGGNKRKIILDLPFHQVEGITTQNGVDYLVSNEKFTQQSIVIEPKLHWLDLFSFLGSYLGMFSTENAEANQQVTIYPNPVSEILHLNLNTINFEMLHLQIYNQLGQKVESHQITSNSFEINVSNYSKGVYYYHILGKGSLKKAMKGKFIVE